MQRCTFCLSFPRNSPQPGVEFETLFPEPRSAAPAPGSFPPSRPTRTAPTRRTARLRPPASLPRGDRQQRPGTRAAAAGLQAQDLQVAAPSRAAAGLLRRPRGASPPRPATRTSPEPGGDPPNPSPAHRRGRRGEAAAARRPCTAAEGSRQLRQRVRILPGRALAPPPPRYLPARRPAPPLPARGNHSPGSASGAARSHGPPARRGTARNGPRRAPGRPAGEEGAAAVVVPALSADTRGTARAPPARDRGAREGNSPHLLLAHECGADTGFLSPPCSSP